MRKFSLPLLLGAVFAIGFASVPGASAQGVSVHVGPGGVAVGQGYRNGQRRDYYERREYRSHGEWRGDRRRNDVIIVKPRRHYERY